MMVASLTIQGGVLLAYEALRAAPEPRLTIRVGGEGAGTVEVEAQIVQGDLIRNESYTCRDRRICSLSFPRNTPVTIKIERAKGSTFLGWGPKAPGRPCWDPDTDEILDGNRDPDACELTLNHDKLVEISFGLVPEQVEVALQQVERDPEPAPTEFTVTLPDPEIEAELLVEPLADLMMQPEPEPPPQQQPPPPPPPEQQQPPPAPQVAQQPPPNMQSVEVPDENEVEEAPDDAAFLSDKNRDVAEQTHAKDTNLERAQDGEGVVSERSDIQSEEIGAAEDEIAQLEDTEPNTLEPERPEESAHSGEDERAVGAVRGDDGQDGEDGDAGDDTPEKDPGVLAMRDLKGKGGVFERDSGDQSGSRGRPGKRGRSGIKTDLDHEDYERIVGKEVAENEVRLGKRELSKRRGRWEKKLGAVKSALENFTPDVKPGNQTALKTRAAPFAVYLARMHRRIHELWGFGFLEDLNGKSGDHPMNNPDLWVELEIVINADGTVHKTTITKHSGLLEFDVAAIDTILTAAPYEPTPNKIRSPDGRVYLRWGFYRNHRQCGTFNAQPFILSEAPSGETVDDGEMVRNVKRQTRRGKKDPVMPVTRAPSEAGKGTTPDIAQPGDQAAKHAANLWVTGLNQRNAQRMAKVSAAPFRSGEAVVANSTAEIAQIYQAIFAELPASMPSTPKLLSPAQYRKLFGTLPAGFTMSKDILLAVVEVKDQRFTLELQRKDGEYKIVALHR